MPLFPVIAEPVPSAVLVGDRHLAELWKAQDNALSDRRLSL